MSKITIRKSQSGWVVIFDDKTNDFIPFLSNEPERFVKFIAEEVAEINLDRVIEFRKQEMMKSETNFERKATS